MLGFLYTASRYKIYKYYRRVTLCFENNTNSFTVGKMNVDAELMFDCLIYLNLFYFPVFGICESIMCIAKYKSIILTSQIGTDAAVVSSVLFAEMLKLVIYRKLREQRKGNLLL